MSTAALLRLTGRWAVRAFALIGNVAILAALSITVLDVCLRWARGTGVAGAVEITEVTLVVLVFASLSIAETYGRNPTTSILTSRLPSRATHSARALTLGLSIVLLVLLVIATARTGLHSFETREYRFGIVQVPIWPAKVIIPVAWLALAVQLISQFINTVRSLRNAEVAAVSTDETLL
jgi:TRAP-type C4-dicarboxylate transport system permease small subunit